MRVVLVLVSRDDAHNDLVTRGAIQELSARVPPMTSSSQQLGIATAGFKFISNKRREPHHGDAVHFGNFRQFYFVHRLHVFTIDEYRGLYANRCFARTGVTPRDRTNSTGEGRPSASSMSFGIGLCWRTFGRMLALILFEHQLLTLHERRRFFVGVRYNGRIGDVDAELVGARDRAVKLNSRTLPSSTDWTLATSPGPIALPKKGAKPSRLVILLPKRSIRVTVRVNCSPAIHTPLVTPST